MYINYYKVTVSDNFGGKTNDYQMTRDAPIINTDKPYGGYHIKKSKKRIYPFYDPFDWFGPHYKEIEDKIKLFNIINSSFEPIDEFIFNALSMNRYPQDYDAKAFALRNSKGGIQLKAHPVTLPKDKIWDSYRRKDSNYAQEVMIHIGGQLNTSGSIMGSVGCFTATEKSKGVEGINNFFNDVRKRAPKDSMIRIKIIGRKNVKWHYQIGEDGKNY